MDLLLRFTFLAIQSQIGSFIIREMRWNVWLQAGYKFLDQVNDISFSRMFIFLVIFLYLIQLVFVTPA
jgi:hypothetical protein